MPRSSVLLLAIAVVSALPNPLDMLDNVEQKAVDLLDPTPPCTGIQIPKVPACFQGSASIMGGVFKETVKAGVKAFDKTTMGGVLSIDATGAVPEHCSALNFTLAGQNVTVPQIDKCLGGAEATIEWCGDQAAILLHLIMPKLPIPTLVTTLATVAC